MKKLSSVEKGLTVLAMIALLAIAVGAYLMRDQWGAVVGFAIAAFILVQYVCYLTIYRPLSITKARRNKLFLAGNVLTIVLIALIMLFARDNFRTFSAALIIILGYIAALVMREVEHTNPANKQKQQEK